MQVERVTAGGAAVENSETAKDRQESPRRKTWNSDTGRRKQRRYQEKSENAIGEGWGKKETPQ